jgi:hypothetical protein
MRRATKFTPLLLAGTAILWCLALEAQNNVTGPGEIEKNQPRAQGERD